MWREMAQEVLGGLEVSDLDLVLPLLLKVTSYPRVHANIRKKGWWGVIAQMTIWAVQSKNKWKKVMRDFNRLSREDKIRELRLFHGRGEPACLAVRFLIEAAEGTVVTLPRRS